MHAFRVESVPHPTDRAKCYFFSAAIDTDYGEARTLSALRAQATRDQLMLNQGTGQCRGPIEH
jgi:hypothetical protein